VLQKYKRINLVLSTNSFQFIPDGIIQGFKQFCQEKAIAYQILDNLSETDIEKGEVFIVFADSDLIRMIKYAGEHHLQLGADIGIISYDDTPMKSVLEKGITVISTDFVAMGKKAAEMILSRKIEKIKNDSGLILRRSL
jgi:DNA-binding LacI/PurR family transcriptional regulator